MGNEDCEITLKYSDTTGISDVTVDADTVVYDLFGRKVSTMQKGVYIVNGKKVLIK